MANLRVVFAEFDAMPALKTKGNPATLDTRDVAGTAVHQPQARVVARPTDTVARTKPDGLRFRMEADRSGR